MFKAKTKEELKARFNLFIDTALDVIKERVPELLPLVPRSLLASPSSTAVALPPPVLLSAPPGDLHAEKIALTNYRREQLRAIVHNYHIACLSRQNHMAASPAQLFAFIEKAKALDLMLDETLPDARSFGAK